MAAPHATTLRDRYTREGLRLIRYTNQLFRELGIDMADLNRELRQIIMGDYSRTGMTKRELDQLIRAVNRAVDQAYGRMAASQIGALETLIGVEAAFALQATELSTALTASQLQRLQSNIVVRGVPVARQWQRLAANAKWQIEAVLRTAVLQGTAAATLRAQLFGSRNLNGLVELHARRARALVDAAVQSARQSAHHATFKANSSDVYALEWFAILDAKLCPDCGLRAGHRYSLDYEPLGHDVPMVGTPPLHYFCRCILLPIRRIDGVEEKGSPGQYRFEDWIEKLSPDEQNELLGKGRARLWRTGRISLRELIGQDGFVMTLEELQGGA